MSLSIYLSLSVCGSLYLSIYLSFSLSLYIYIYIYIYIFLTIFLAIPFSPLLISPSPYEKKKRSKNLPSHLSHHHLLLLLSPDCGVNWRGNSIKDKNRPTGAKTIIAPSHVGPIKGKSPDTRKHMEISGNPPLFDFHWLPG